VFVNEALRQPSFFGIQRLEMHSGLPLATKYALQLAMLILPLNESQVEMVGFPEAIQCWDAARACRRPM